MLRTHPCIPLLLHGRHSLLCDQPLPPVVATGVCLEHADDLNDVQRTDLRMESDGPGTHAQAGSTILPCAEVGCSGSISERKKSLRMHARYPVYCVHVDGCGGQLLSGEGAVGAASCS